MTAPVDAPLRCTLGIDVGGTKLAAGLLPLDGPAHLPAERLLVERTVPTRPERGGQAVLDATVALARAVLHAAGPGVSVAGIGVGVCELVDGAGSVTSGHTVAWEGCDVRAALAQAVPGTVPVAVEADVRAHALAEARLGAGRAWPNFVFITVGTGISSCLVLGGEPYAGVNGNALILASSPTTVQCIACGATTGPVLEELASGPALATQYAQATGQPMGQINGRAETVLAAAAAGEAQAIAVVHQAALLLGSAIGWLVNVLDPGAVVVGGGLGSAGGLYWDALVAATRDHIWSAQSRRLPIVPAQLGPAAGVMGAALAARRLVAA